MNDDMSDEDLVRAATTARRDVARVQSSLSTAPTAPYSRTDESDEACVALLDEDSDSDTDSDTGRAPRLHMLRLDPDADLRPEAEAVSAEAEIDTLDLLRQLASSADLSLAIGQRLLRRARPAAYVVAVVSGLLVLVGALLGAVATLGGCLMVLR